MYCKNYQLLHYNNFSHKTYAFGTVKFNIPENKDDFNLTCINTKFKTYNQISNDLIKMNLAQSDIATIQNHRDSWEYVLSKRTLLLKTNFFLLRKINKLILNNEKGGIIRHNSVSIIGSSWAPPIPIKNSIIENINIIMNSEQSKIDIGIELLLFLIKSQPFNNGNKRTAILFVNHYLITNKIGMILIPMDYYQRFIFLLLGYFEGRTYKEIKTFLKEKCFQAF